MNTISQYVEHLLTSLVNLPIKINVLDNINKSELLIGDEAVIQTALYMELSESKDEFSYTATLPYNLHELKKQLRYEIDLCCGTYYCNEIQVSSNTDIMERNYFFNNNMNYIVEKNRVPQLEEVIYKYINILDAADCTVVSIGRTSDGKYLIIRTKAVSFDKAVKLLSQLELLCLDNTAALDNIKILEVHQQVLLSVGIMISESGLDKKYFVSSCFPMFNDNYAAAVLSQLMDYGFCSKLKKNISLQWADNFPTVSPPIYNDISNITLELRGREILSSKAVLRQSYFQHKDYKAFETPLVMNIELTDRCPLKCPQCYCQLNNGKDISKETALKWIRQAAKNHVQSINLSGGETIVYPYLIELIEECAKYKLAANAAFSGWNFTTDTVNRLMKAGISGIFISLNGSTKEINSLSRDGYEYAISALEILSKSEFKNVYINWVMHSFNADDFEEMLIIAEKYKVKAIVIMAFKPDSKHTLPSIPAAKQMEYICSVVENYNGKVKIEVESCFSQMRALLSQRFVINTNKGLSKGCGAGRYAISVNVNGELTPCRHLELPEKYETIEEYWNKSTILEELRSVEETPQKPCGECRFDAYCRHCMAINYKINNRIYKGNESCSFK